MYFTIWFWTRRLKLIGLVYFNSGSLRLLLLCAAAEEARWAGDPGELLVGGREWRCVYPPVALRPPVGRGWPAASTSPRPRPPRSSRDCCRACPRLCSRLWPPRARRLDRHRKSKVNISWIIFRFIYMKLFHFYCCTTLYLSEVRWYEVPPITDYWTVPLIVDHSYLVGKSTSSKIADTKVKELWRF